MADKDKAPNFKDRLGDIAGKLATSKSTTPIQEVVPVVPKEEKPAEAQLNVWIPKDLLKRMKRHGLDADMSLKEIAIKALEAYLPK